MGATNDPTHPLIPSPWLRMADAATYTTRHPQTLSKEIRAGRLRAAKVGGRGEYFFRAEWLDEWMESQATPVVLNSFRRRG